MNGRNIAEVAIILIFTGFAVIFMMYETRRIDVGIGNQRTEQNTEDLCAQLNELDYEIYWIGSLPLYLDGISEHVTILTAGQAGYSTLPVSDGDTGFTEYDEAGNVLQDIEKRDYADYMMIVINTEEEISRDTWEQIRDCTVNNRVPVLLIGKDNIDAFREYMIFVHKEYDDNATMLFDIGRGPIDNPIESETVEAGGHAYADRLLGFFADTFADRPVIYVTAAPEQTSAPSDAEITAEPETEETGEDQPDAA